jgi:hypothetical protein
MEDVRTPDGQIYTIPKIVIAVHIWRGLSEPFGAVRLSLGTICDRDFAVERVENDYIITAGRQTPDLRPGSPAWQLYLDAMALKGVSV